MSFSESGRGQQQEGEDTSRGKELLQGETTAAEGEHSCRGRGQMQDQTSEGEDRCFAMLFVVSYDDRVSAMLMCDQPLQGRSHTLVPHTASLLLSPEQLPGYSQLHKH
jgi:hypothetical protein